MQIMLCYVLYRALSLTLVSTNSGLFISTSKQGSVFELLFVYTCLGVQFILLYVKSVQPNILLLRLKYLTCHKFHWVKVK